MEAARRWMTAPPTKPEVPLEDQLAAFGLKAEGSLQDGGKGGAFMVWPENWEAFKMFTGLDTQWKIHQSGELLGLDYAGVHAYLSILQVPDMKAAMVTIQKMERAALTARVANVG